MGSTTAPAASALSNASRLRILGAIRRAASNAATALLLFLPPVPSISPGEKPARSRSTCISSSEVPAVETEGAGRLVAINVDAPSRIATLAARHDKALRVNFVAHFSATTLLLRPKRKPHAPQT